MVNDAEEKTTGIFQIIYAYYERILESKTSSNLFIIALLILIALPIAGIGIAVTRAAAPVHAQEE
jgi:hypothetical protein